MSPRPKDNDNGRGAKSGIVVLAACPTYLSE